MNPNDHDSMSLSRRAVLMGAAGALAASALPAMAQTAKPAPPPITFDLEKIEKVIVNGRINQGVCGCGLRMSLDQKCQLVSKLGFRSVDFTGPNDWPILKKYNLVASLCGGAGGIANSTLR